MFLPKINIALYDTIFAIIFFLIKYKPLVLVNS